MTDIFISYSRQDTELVFRLATALEKLGYSVWWDAHGLHGGQAFAAEIQGAINRAKCAIVIWSEASVASNWVHSEATQADSQGILLTAIYQDAQIPLPFNNRHNESLRNWQGEPDDPEFQLLLKAVTRYCAPSVNEKSAGLSAVPPATPVRKATAASKGETVVLGAAVPWRAGVSVALLVAVGALFAFFPAYDKVDPTVIQPSVSVQEAPVSTPVVPASGRPSEPPSALKPFSPRPKMVSVPAGTFRMGCVDGRDEAHGVCDNNEKPWHTVKVPGFMMAETEVTVGQFRAFVDDVNYVTSAELEAGGCWVDRLRGGPLGHKNRYSWKKPGFEQADEHPVVCVSRKDVQAYVEWLGEKTGENYRLPSEAEWEYAARGGNDEQVYPWGDHGNDSCAFANMADQKAKTSEPYEDWTRAVSCNDGYLHTAPVKAFNANGFGLYDMHGNAAEWVEDINHANYRGAPVNGSVWSAGDGIYHMIRGGSWRSGPKHVRSAARYSDKPDTRYFTLGFRLAQAIR